MRIHPRPRDRTEVADSRHDACRLLEFYESVQGKVSEGLGRAVNCKLPSGRAYVFSNKELLKFVHIVPDDAIVKITKV